MGTSKQPSGIPGESGPCLSDLMLGAVPLLHTGRWMYDAVAAVIGAVMQQLHASKASCHDEAVTCAVPLISPSDNSSCTTTLKGPLITTCDLPDALWWCKNCCQNLPIRRCWTRARENLIHMHILMLQRWPLHPVRTSPTQPRLSKFKSEAIAPSQRYRQSKPTWCCL